MEKDMIPLATSKVQPRTASTQDLYLDKDFLLWPSFTLLEENELKQFLKYNIRLIWTEDQEEFLTENELNLYLEDHTKSKEGSSKIKSEEENQIFWQSYHSYFSFIEKIVSQFRKTGQINSQDISPPYTAFSWKLRESGLGLEVLDCIREIAFGNPDRFHIHIILSLTILTTLQGITLNMDIGDLKELAFSSTIATLGLFLVPLNQKDLFSPNGFLARHLTTEEERKAYESYPILSKKIAAKNLFSSTTVNLVLTHREMINQKGFPFRPPAFKILQSAQILGLSYKLSQFFFSSLEKESLYQSFLKLYKNFGDGYDRSLFFSLLDLIIPYKPQDIVQLENGSLAKVVKINDSHPKRPFLTLDIKSKDPKEADFFVAGERSETTITKVLNEIEIKLL